MEKTYWTVNDIGSQRKAIPGALPLLGYGSRHFSEAEAWTAAEKTQCEVSIVRIDQGRKTFLATFPPTTEELFVQAKSCLDQMVQSGEKSGALVRLAGDIGTMRSNGINLVSERRRCALQLKRHKEKLGLK